MNAPHPSYCREASLHSLSCVVAFAVLVTLLPSRAAKAQRLEGDALRETVEKYLTSAEPPKEGEAPIKDEVIQKLEDRLRAAGQDSRVSVAKMFVAVRRGDFRSANKRFMELPRDYQRLPLVLRTRIWASIHTADDVGAQREMFLLNAIAARVDDIEKSKQAADFSGQMYGYLAGPLGRAQKELEKGVFQSLAPEYQPFFVAGRQEVGDRHAAIAAKLNVATEKAKTKEREQRQRDIRTIVAQLAELDKELKPKLDELRKLESELARELKLDEGDLRLLSKQMADIDRTTAALRKQITGLKTRITELRAAAADEPDPTKKQMLLSDATRFEALLTQLEIDVTKQDTRLMALLREKRVTRADIDKQRKKLDPQRKAVQELTEKADMLRGKATELRTAPILGRSAEVLSLQRQAEALETYLPEFWSAAKAAIIRSFD